jgi:hypothetical protein
VHGACFDGATSLEQPELIANEGAAFIWVGPTTVCHAKAGRENRCREKLEKWQFGLFAGANVYSNEFPMHLLKLQLYSDKICQGATDMEDATYSQAASSGSDLCSK